MDDSSMSLFCFQGGDAMACCLSPSCCPSRGSRRPASKSSGRRVTSVCRSRKSTASSPTADPSTPRTSTVVPVVVDRLRRQLCQTSGSVTDNYDAPQGRTRCGCCQRCLGENDGEQAVVTELDQSPVHPATLSPKLTVSGTSPGTTDDFMTQFFRNCERIVLDNASGIREILSAPAHEEEEQHQGSTCDDWTSNRTEPSSSTNTVEQRRRISHDDDDDVANVWSDIVTEGELCRTEDASTSCGRTDGSVERLVAPANSPASAGSMLTSTVSDDVLLTPSCVCSTSIRITDVGDDHLYVQRRPSVSGQSPAAVNWTADRSVSFNSHFPRPVHTLWVKNMSSYIVA